MAYLNDAELLALGGMPSHVLLEDYSASDRETAVVKAGEIADGYARPHYSPPFTAPQADWKMRVAHIAIYLLASQTGPNPDGADGYIVKNYDVAIRWLERVQEGKVVLASTADQTPSTNEGAPMVISSPSRGW